MLRWLGKGLLWLCAALGGAVLTLGLLLLAFASHGYSPALPKTMILSLDLRYGIAEHESYNPLDYLLGRPAASTREVVMALFDAAIDPGVQALVIRADDATLGLAQAQELYDAVAYFRSFDKPVYAYGDSFGIEAGGTNGYLIASAADEIWLQPSGDWALLGFIWQLPYAAQLLETIGIKAEFTTREEYKSAMQSFTHSSMPEHERTAILALGGNVMQQKLTAIAQSRNLDPALSNLWVEQSPMSAAEALGLGLVTNLGYAQELEAALMERYGKDTPWLDIADYAQHTTSEPAAATVAVIYANGPIERGEPAEDYWPPEHSVYADQTAHAILDAADDPAIRAIVLRVDSPGGSYIASDTIWHAVSVAKKTGKPVYAVFGNVAASGGYFIAMGADKIFASPGSITGSIGVVAGKFSIAGLLQKLQITFDSVQIGTNADLWSPVNGFTPAGRAKLEEFADRSYQDFMTKAAQGRNMPLEAIHDLAKGQVWTGEQAWDLGLVDGLGGWMEAEDNLYQALALKDGERIAYSVYPKPAEDIQGILSGLGGYLAGAQASVLQKAWQRVTTSPISIQARLWATPQ